LCLTAFFEENDGGGDHIVHLLGSFTVCNVKTKFTFTGSYVA